jgi:hypothetical protein
VGALLAMVVVAFLHCFYSTSRPAGFYTGVLRPAVFLIGSYDYAVGSMLMGALAVFFQYKSFLVLINILRYGKI